MKASALLAASDKTIFDALNQKSVTNTQLRTLFLSRGIVVSSETPRRELASMFARLNHDFQDYQLLASLFASPIRREKMTSSRAAAKISLETFENAAFGLKEDLEKAGAVVRVVKVSNDQLSLHVKYQALNFSKSEFRQVVTKTALISIEQDSNGTVIRRPLNDDTEGWVDELKDRVQELHGDDAQFEELTLNPALPANIKSDFFTRLARNLETFTFQDVSDVYVSRPRIEETDEEAESEVDMEVHISKASLRGRGVLQSIELRQLQDKGFYISRIVWTSKAPSLDSDIYEFEAQFSLAEDCSEFSYLARGFYRYLGPGDYASTRTAFTAEEDHRLGRLIESSASAARHHVLRGHSR